MNPYSSSEAVHHAAGYPALRYMGSKQRLLPWIADVVSDYRFETVLDAFSGSGCVSYLFKAMGKQVIANDFLLFPTVIAKATVENSATTLRKADVEMILGPPPKREHFVERTYKDIFFTPTDLRFIDRASVNIRRFRSPYKRAIALAALMRACAKRQPRGVFTFVGSDRYDDGRRDLRLSVKQHFVEQVAVYNQAVFDMGRNCAVSRFSIEDIPLAGFDLVYLDPPYVPRADDNCYVKRYHFLEGLASYWTDDDAQPDTSTKVRKIPKRYTPFSYRHSAVDAFDRMFKRFSESTIVLSYSSNGYPDLEVLVDLMGRYKASVEVNERDHRYHFGTHAGVAQERAAVSEYLIVGHG